MSQILVASSEGKIKPHGNVHHDRLLVFAFERERADNAAELQIPYRDFTRLNYHTKRTTAPAMAPAATPNQMLRAVA